MKFTTCVHVTNTAATRESASKCPFHDDNSRNHSRSRSPVSDMVYGSSVVNRIQVFEQRNQLTFNACKVDFNAMYNVDCLSYCKVFIFSIVKGR